MAGASLVTGSYDDSVTLKIAGDQVLIAESWEVHEAVLSTPGRFALTLGQSTPVAKLFTSQTPAVGKGSNGYEPQSAARYQIGDPFELYIGDAIQMNGIYEGFRVSGAATRIELKGRDMLSVLMRTHSEAQRSFIDGSYADLVQWAFQEAGIPCTLFFTNAANRQVKAGIPIDAISEPTTIDAIDAAGTAGNGQTTGTLIGGIVKQSHQNRIHENLLAFCRRHLDRAGLFLWAGATPQTYILGQPNGAQDPCLRITRKRGSAMQASNVIDVTFVNDVTERHGQCTIYGRGGGGKGGRSKAKGAYIDPEMHTLGEVTGAKFGDQGILFRDVNVQSTEQAEFTAQRKICEERRNCWSLTYTISGHRLPTVDGNAWGVVTPDTVILIEDDELGINDTFYVEGVSRMRYPQTCTQIRFMRIQDLIFATGGVE